VRKSEVEGTRITYSHCASSSSLSISVMAMTEPPRARTWKEGSSGAGEWAKVGRRESGAYRARRCLFR
jgi:hypothetical protein